MNKKGLAEIIVGIVLAAVIIGGIITSQRIIEENRYVVDAKTGLIYDLSKCSINNLDQNSLVEIRDIDEVLKNEKYSLAKCSGR